MILYWGTDQNINLLNTENSQVKNLLETLYEANLCPTITKPTRISKTSATLIDQIYVTENLYRRSSSHIILCDTSDHLPCMIKVKDKGILEQNSDRKVTGRCLSDNNITRLIAHLNSFNWENLNMFQVEEAFENFMCTLNTGLDNIMPIKEKLVKAKKIIREPWMTKSLYNCSRKCKKLYSKWVQNRTDITEIAYKNYRNTFNSVKRKSKFLYIDNFFKENQNNMKRSWKMLNKIIGRCQDRSTLPTYIMNNGIKIEEGRLMANEFNNFFGNIGKNCAAKIPPSSKNFMSYMGKRINKTLKFTFTNPKMIAEMISGLKNKISSGHDGLTNKFLKRMCNAICIPISILINMSLKENIIPKELKYAQIVPLYKSGERTLVTNYRPISLLPVISKIFEKVVYTQTYEFLESNEILHRNQFGFRKNSSCNDCVNKFLTDISKYQSDKGNNYALAIMADLSKAFDSIPQKTITKKIRALRCSRKLPRLVY